MSRKPIRLLLIALTLSATSCTNSCDGKKQDPDPRGRQASSSVSVLVDLSQTWHNPPATEETNANILRQVGQAIVRAAPNMPMPIAIRYHAIGEASLGRTPLCVAVYRPTTFRIGQRSGEVVRDRRTFNNYVTEECPLMFLSRRPEQQTEIAATIISAYRASALLKEDVHRTFVILSDFKEETPTTFSFQGIDLARSHFILIYRTLDEDRRAPELQEKRLSGWEQLLTRLGAKVSRIDENAVLGSPQEFQILLGA